MQTMKTLLILSICLFSMGIQAASHSMAKISLGFGKLDVSSGSGYLKVSTDAQNKITSISIDVTAGFFGYNTKIQHKEALKDLMNGGTLDFYMDGGASPVLKIKALTGFNANGGKLKLSVLKKDGYASSTIELARAVSNKKFYAWNGNSMISEVAINMRGYSIADMYVGWYELR
jgi:hypothetical protein